MSVSWRGGWSVLSRPSKESVARVAVRTTSCRLVSWRRQLNATGDSLSRHRGATALTNGKETSYRHPAFPPRGNAGHQHNTTACQISPKRHPPYRKDQR
ncbi:unnamed protein product [Ectocarpus sp. 12 AP-2014]